MKKILYLLLLVSFFSLDAQLLELDYRSPVKKESFFKVNILKKFIGGVTTLGHLDFSTELMGVDYKSSKRLMGGLYLLSTYTVISGNKDVQKNNLSHLLNPLGGWLNGGFYFSVSLREKEKSSLKISSRMGIKGIQGTPLKGFKTNFTSNYGSLGLLYQRLFNEDALENKRIDFWINPRLMMNQTNSENLEHFFDNELKPISYGYGLQTGLEFNQKLRLVFLLNQFINTHAAESVGIPVLRFGLVYLR